MTFIRNQPLILSTMILDFIATFFSSANTLLPFFAQNVLHIGEVAYGWLAAAQSIGAVLVGIIASQVRHIRYQGMLLLGSVVVFGAATILFGFSRLYAVIFLALALTGAAELGQYYYPQYDPAAQHPRFPARAYDQHQSDFLHGRTAVGRN